MQTQALPRYPLTLYYDGSCRLCSAEIRNLQARDGAARLRFVDCSAADFSGGPAPLEAMMAAIHAVDAAGRVYVGVPTLRAAYAAVGLTGRSSLLALPGVRGLAARAYQLLARNRHHLPDHLIELLFERASQHAAQRAVRRTAACREGACERPHEADRKAREAVSATTPSMIEPGAF
ncbi:DUF393 domain-containing protein [Xenophilus arseniciresistens]|uniref:DUF393 domain-containing protein n=1 Tax=Xenophilus arseniciresistens TaxID=1283306 RepID=A0AAE3NA70_9BURK|nr:DUF393 domain-containing protein [Xenophilus arseniciresistens]MDA7417429.1 DUF393 domain-containing protein [Xenophilus arseniciresistens]